MPEGLCPPEFASDIRHHEQEHASIWVMPIDGDKIHVSVGSRGGCESIVLTSEICASLFATAALTRADHSADHTST